MHQFPLLPQPLRSVIGADARRHDRRWRAGRRRADDVSRGDDRARSSTPATMASDGFHPGEPVYRACGEALGLHIARHLA